MRYAFVQNGIVVDGPRALPATWRNYSNFDKMSPKALLSLGWLPWSFVETPVGPDEIISGTSIEVKSSEVVETRLVRKKTAEDVAAENSSRAVAMKSLRAEAYKEEADPLFFKAQRGEIPLSDWTAKVAEIRARFPY